MELIKVDRNIYKEIINAPYHIFNSADFNLLNKNKCEKLYFFLFKEKKYCLGLIAGLVNNSIISPFSAPFGSFSFIKEDIRISHIENAIDELEKFALANKKLSIKHILPPVLYHESFLSKLINVLYRKGYNISNVDTDYYFNLANFNDNYIKILWGNARKNLNISLKHNFVFRRCKTRQDKKSAYHIIKVNRQSKGYLLKMEYDEIIATSKIIKTDFFIVHSYDREAASAIVFHVAPHIVQVIYWGDVPDFSEYKLMNFLSYKIFEYYKGKKIKYVDIGPSTENSIPNYGLGEFKESIGCNLSPKLSFHKQM